MAQVGATSMTHAKSAARCVSGQHGMGGMDSADASLAEYIGKQAGTHLAGQAPMTVSPAHAKALGNQLPRRAQVDACADRITFTTASVSFVVVAVPPSNPDMTFRTAGLVNPTIVVPRHAQVNVEFINADNDEAHAWLVTTAQSPFSFRAGQPPFGFGHGSSQFTFGSDRSLAFAGAFAAPIGDPTAAGDGAEVMTFTANTAGTYSYLCPMPGHAEMGMYGTFIVR